MNQIDIKKWCPSYYFSLQVFSTVCSLPVLVGFCFTLSFSSLCVRRRGLLYILLLSGKKVHWDPVPRMSALFFHRPPIYERATDHTYTKGCGHLGKKCGGTKCNCQLNFFPGEEVFQATDAFLAPTPPPLFPPPTKPGPSP